MSTTIKRLQELYIFLCTSVPSVVFFLHHREPGENILFHPLLRVLCVLRGEFLFTRVTMINDDQLLQLIRNYWINYYLKPHRVAG